MPGCTSSHRCRSTPFRAANPCSALRHAITNTNYYVQIFAAARPEDSGLRRAVPAAQDDLHWMRTSRLGSLPLTGLARKILQRLDVMRVNLPKLPDDLRRSTT